MIRCSCTPEISHGHAARRQTYGHLSIRSTAAVSRRAGSLDLDPISHTAPWTHPTHQPEEHLLITLQGDAA